ncbi:hypothetical protein [Embleya sp. NBC_00896]|uniref:hypothetical protein n=1 Tax=Embleya sp. NBC_00896 TaxID=2975961 RepID=UPI0038633439|nr:hypothetical protein OG928_12810 [Embleya sp. NBC_00896]
MGRTADIDFKFESSVDIGDVLSGLRGHGVSFTMDGGVSYVVDEDGLFDWIKVEQERMPEVLRRFAQADAGTTTIGISALLDEFPRGGDLLFLPGRRTISFLIEINRKNLSAESSFCDLGWYIHRLVPALEPFGLNQINTSDLPY